MVKETKKGKCDGCSEIKELAFECPECKERYCKDCKERFNGRCGSPIHDSPTLEKIK